MHEDKGTGIPCCFSVFKSLKVPRGVTWSLNPESHVVSSSWGGIELSDPVLVTAKVQKKNVFALKLDREEEEIITFKARRVGKELIA